MIVLSQWIGKTVAVPCLLGETQATVKGGGDQPSSTAQRYTKCLECCKLRSLTSPLHHCCSVCYIILSTTGWCYMFVLHCNKQSMYRTVLQLFQAFQSHLHTAHCNLSHNYGIEMMVFSLAICHWNSRETQTFNALIKWGITMCNLRALQETLKWQYCLLIYLC